MRKRGWDAVPDATNLLDARNVNFWAQGGRQTPFSQRSEMDYAGMKAPVLAQKARENWGTRLASGERLL